MTPEHVTRTLEKWRSVDVFGEPTCIAAAACSEEALRAFEARHAIVLPESFRALWRESDGTEMPDAHGISFYSLAVIDAHQTERDGEHLWVGFGDRHHTDVIMLRYSAGTFDGVYAADRTRTHESFDAFLGSYVSMSGPP